MFTLIFAWFCVFIVSIITILLLILTYYSIVLPAPYIPSSNRAIKNLLQNIDILDLKNKKTFYELGSGDGKVISKIASIYPHLKCIGVEYNLGAYFLSYIRNFFVKNKVRYIRKNFFDVNLQDADVVFTYLFPEVMDKLEKKFDDELKSGTFVVSNTFPLKNKQPYFVCKDQKPLSSIYIYKY